VIHRSGLQKLEELVNNINDIIENRIEKSLKVVSKTLLVDLPEGHSFTVEDFVKIQEKHITAQSLQLQGKNVEIEHAVEDLVKIISAYQLDAHVESVSEDEIMKLKRHYNHFMYQVGCMHANTAFRVPALDHIIYILSYALSTGFTSLCQELHEYSQEEDSFPFRLYHESHDQTLL